MSSISQPKISLSPSDMLSKFRSSCSSIAPFRLADQSQPSAPSGSCPSCTTDLSRVPSVVLPHCGDAICVCCLFNYLKYRITSVPIRDQTIPCLLCDAGFSPSYLFSFFELIQKSPELQRILGLAPEGNCKSEAPAWPSAVPAEGGELMRLVKLFETKCIDNFVCANRYSFTYCSTAGCGGMFDLKAAAGPFERCALCKEETCLVCGKENHRPLACRELHAWARKLAREHDNLVFMRCNTKTCPKCRTRIQRTEGCNHIICQYCQFQWCWVCENPWDMHGTKTGGYFRCFLRKNRTAKEPEEEGQHQRESSIELLDRYANLEGSHSALVRRVRLENVSERIELEKETARALRMLKYMLVKYKHYKDLRIRATFDIFESLVDKILFFLDEDVGVDSFERVMKKRQYLLEKIQDYQRYCKNFLISLSE